jgi:hypothetical protein
VPIISLHSEESKNRRKFTVELSHFKWLDERFALPIPAKTAHTVKEIAALLRSKGAGPTVWIISEQSNIDAQELGLEDALGEIWGRGIGSVLSCTSLPRSHVLTLHLQF